MGWFSSAFKFAGAALNVFGQIISSDYIQEEDQNHKQTNKNHLLIGNVYIGELNGIPNSVFTKKLPGEKKIYSGLLTLSATNKEGGDPTIIELIANQHGCTKSGESINSQEVEELIKSNATGSLTWSKHDPDKKQKNNYYSSIKDWNGNEIEMFNLKNQKESHTKEGLVIYIDRKKNILYTKAENASFNNVHIHIIGYDGSDYDFAPFDITTGSILPLHYPQDMDILLPFTRTSVWFELDDEQSDMVQSLAAKA